MQSNHVLPYSFRAPIPDLDPKKLYFGVELEVERKPAMTDEERRTRKCNDDLAADIMRQFDGFLYCKEDGSLNTGFEMVTPPLPLAEHRKKWGEFFDARKKGGDLASLKGFSTTTAGMHVHISKSPLTRLQVAKMLVFINAPHNRRLIRAIASRKENTYCLLEKKKHKDVNNTPDRYVGLNLRNSSTVEVRIFRSNLSRSGFFRNLEFCDSLVAFCAPGTASIEACTRGREFRRFVQGRKKDWPYLASFLGRLEKFFRAKSSRKGAGRPRRDFLMPESAPDQPSGIAFSPIAEVWSNLFHGYSLSNFWRETEEAMGRFSPRCVPCSQFRVENLVSAVMECGESLSLACTFEPPDIIRQRILEARNDFLAVASWEQAVYYGAFRFPACCQSCVLSRIQGHHDARLGTITGRAFSVQVRNYIEQSAPATASAVIATPEDCPLVESLEDAF